MIISNNDLVSRLNIIEYDESQPQEKYRYSFYIRSWKFSVEAIDRIMNEFLIEDTYSSVMEFWFMQIGARKDALHYYIRYVGFCVSSNPKDSNLTSRYVCSRHAEEYSQPVLIWQDENIQKLQNRNENDANKIQIYGIHV